MDNIKILVLPGSLREGSFTKQLVNTFPQLAPENVEISIFPLHDIPLYNQDVEDLGFPAAVRQLREAVSAADGLIFATPEYNGAMSGVLKNAIDWASRKGLLARRPAAAISGSTGALGGTKAQENLRSVLNHIGMYVLPKPAIAVPQLDKKLENGELSDPAARKFVTDLLQEFRDWVVRMG